MLLYHSTVFHLLCFFHGYTTNATKQQGSGGRYCHKEKLVKAEEGESVSLVSNIEARQTCYFVFTQHDSNLRCCYGPKETCEAAKHTSDEKCHEHNIKVDSMDTLTCNLSMENIKTEDSGFYTVFNFNDSEVITKCHMLVRVSELSHWMATTSVTSVTSATTSVIVVLVCISFVLVWVKRKRVSQPEMDEMQLE